MDQCPICKTGKHLGTRGPRGRWCSECGNVWEYDALQDQVKNAGGEYRTRGGSGGKSGSEDDLGDWDIEGSPDGEADRSGDGGQQGEGDSEGDGSESGAGESGDDGDGKSGDGKGDGESEGAEGAEGEGEGEGEGGGGGAAGELIKAANILAHALTESGIVSLPAATLGANLLSVMTTSLRYRLGAGCTCDQCVRMASYDVSVYAYKAPKEPANAGLILARVRAIRAAAVRNFPDYGTSDVEVWLSAAAKNLQPFEGNPEYLAAKKDEFPLN